MVKLSEATLHRLRALFGPEDIDNATLLLEVKCADNLPFMDGADEGSLERIRFAAIKMSDGHISKLSVAVRLAQTDWRDLLAAAGFADDLTAHLAWQP